LPFEEIEVCAFDKLLCPVSANQVNKLCSLLAGARHVDSGAGKRHPRRHARPMKTSCRPPPRQALPAPLPRWLTILPSASLALAIVAMTVPWPVGNQDFWIHLSAGRYIVETGWVPLTDSFSYNASQHAYVVPAWLTSVLYLLIFHTAGGTGIIV